MKPRKHRNKKQLLAEQVSLAATAYLKNWTNRQISQIQEKEKTPVCIPTSTGYRVGLYRLLINKNQTCDVFDPNGDFVNRFDNKISAIIYAVYTIKRRYHMADQILRCDQEINKRYTDSLFLRKAIQRGIKSSNYFLVDLSRARLEQAETQLKFARDKLLKMCKTAKYMKVWE